MTEWREEGEEKSDPTLVEVRATDIHVMRDCLKNESGM